jgi:Uncharacterized enzyme involved in biosynthesis of extracellular polysaccharides
MEAGLPFGKLFFEKVNSCNIAFTNLHKMKMITLWCMLLLGSSSMPDKKYIVEVIRYKIPADQQQNFEAAYAEGGKSLKASPYCLHYEVVHGMEEPEKYIVRIHWTSKEDHEKLFRQSAEFSSFFKEVRPFFNNIEEMKHYDLTTISWTK